MCEHLVNESEPHLTSVPYLCLFQGQISSREAHLLPFTRELLRSVGARVKWEEAQTPSLSFCGVPSVSAGEEYSHLSTQHTHTRPLACLLSTPVQGSKQAVPSPRLVAPVWGQELLRLASWSQKLQVSCSGPSSTAYLHPITDPLYFNQGRTEKLCGEVG